MIAATVGVAAYLYHQKSDNLKEFVGLTAFIFTYHFLTKAPKESIVR